jgi:MHS family proline/betaine transporter-like MFS transporter
MTIGTATIAFLPTYDQIGIAASVLLVLGRLLQGLAAGGEVGSAFAFLLETARRERRCLFVSWQGASQGAAILLGAIVGVGVSRLMPEDALLSWGWRIPFIVGLAIGPVGIYIRRHLEETARPIDLRRAKIGSVFVQQWRTLILGTLLMTGTTASMYVMVLYMPTYLVRTLGVPPVAAFLAACVAGIVFLVFSPLGGLLADRLPRRKPILFVLATLSLVGTYPAFQILTAGPSLAGMMLVIGLAVALNALTGSAGGVLMMEALPCYQRATGMSMMYALGVTLFGGLSPLIVTWLIERTGSKMAPAGYLVAALTISLIALALFPSNPRYAEGRDDPHEPGDAEPPPRVASQPG